MFVKITDYDGKPVDIVGLSAVEPFGASANTTHNFASPVRGFNIVNDGNADLTFTINGATFTVKQGEMFSEIFQPYTSVTVTTTVAFRAYGRR